MNGDIGMSKPEKHANKVTWEPKIKQSNSVYWQLKLKIHAHLQPCVIISMKTKNDG